MEKNYLENLLLLLLLIKHVKTDGSPRRAIVQQMEPLRQEVLTRVLDRHADMEARSVKVFQISRQPVSEYENIV